MDSCVALRLVSSTLYRCAYTGGHLSPALFFASHMPPFGIGGTSFRSPDGWIHFSVRQAILSRARGVLTLRQPDHMWRRSAQASYPVR
eukprot:scaffold196351_cov30-Tisochrysis_lutea.AAC.1